jgi:hypothetical protein
LKQQAAAAVASTMALQNKKMPSGWDWRCVGNRDTSGSRPTHNRDCWVRHADASFAVKLTEKPCGKRKMCVIKL